jgi:hypothetical protein
LKDFMKLYGASADDVERQKALEALSQELLQPAELDGRRITPYALRRLKEDVAKDLPAKHHGPMLRADMPAQASPKIRRSEQRNTGGANKDFKSAARLSIYFPSSDRS